MQRAPVDAVVLTEPGILGGDHGGQEGGRNLAQPHIGSLIALALDLAREHECRNGGFESIEDDQRCKQAGKNERDPGGDTHQHG